MILVRSGWKRERLWIVDRKRNAFVAASFGQHLISWACQFAVNDAHSMAPIDESAAPLIMVVINARRTA